jgi:hypothetical protein
VVCSNAVVLPFAALAPLASNAAVHRTAVDVTANKNPTLEADLNDPENIRGDLSPPQLDSTLDPSLHLL